MQNLPIKDGAIRYVLKYLTKDTVAFREKYGLERMFRYSSGLGKGFIEEHIDEIIENQGCYDNGSGKLKSLPAYWLNKLRVRPTTNYNSVRKQMSEDHYDDKREWYTYSRTECLNYMKQKSQLKEIMAINRSRDKGNAQDDFDLEKSETLWKEKI